ncbi:MAG: DUF2520 domain-containing protein [Muribaculaceae bacterium]|nr:DUF2520 domain-containing protein [Muribaculaceae bacterium]
MKVAVIGKGKVGTQLARIFHTRPIDSRTLEGLDPDAGLIVIAVSDSAVKEVAGKLRCPASIVVHTSGSVPKDALRDVECRGYGVFYPFQTISKARDLTPDRIPLLLEAGDADTLRVLAETAAEYGFKNIAEADSATRGKIHLAGVFACNFSNALMAISRDILDKCRIDHGIINPLVEETIEKLKTVPPREAQTGPAVRKDFPTMERHTALLESLGMKREREIYDLISDYIISNS